MGKNLIFCVFKEGFKCYCFEKVLLKYKEYRSFLGFIVSLILIIFCGRDGIKLVCNYIKIYIGN